MRGGRTLHWLHRVGYFTTALIALELGFFGYHTVRFWAEERKRDEWRIEESRTHEGRLKPSKDVVTGPDLVDLINELPSPNARSSDTFRFAAMRSLDRTWYAYSVEIPNIRGDAVGILLIFYRKYGPDGQWHVERSDIPFHMPRSQVEEALSEIDRIVSGWPGESGRLCIDGTGVAFERIQRGRAISGIGSATCSNHYGRLSLRALAVVEHVLPASLRPKDLSWSIPAASTNAR